MKIGYVSEPEREWSDAVSKAESIQDLKAAAKKFYPIAWDAADVIDKMTDADFTRFVECRAKERRDEYSGDENQELMGPILMPETMMKVGMVAVQYFVPWGCAFIRMTDAGIVKNVGGRYIVEYPAEAA